MGKRYIVRWTQTGTLAGETIVYTSESGARSKARANRMADELIRCTPNVQAVSVRPAPPPR